MRGATEFVGCSLGRSLQINTNNKKVTIRRRATQQSRVARGGRASRGWREAAHTAAVRGVRLGFGRRAPRSRANKVDNTKIRVLANFDGLRVSDYLCPPHRSLSTTPSRWVTWVTWVTMFTCCDGKGSYGVRTCFTAVYDDDTWTRGSTYSERSVSMRCP